MADRDNRHKISMDALEWVVYEDDKQVKKITGVEMYKDKENPRIEILLQPMTHEEIMKFQSRSWSSQKQTLRS